MDLDLHKFFCDILGSRPRGRYNSTAYVVYCCYPLLESSLLFCYGSRNPQHYIMEAFISLTPRIATAYSILPISDGGLIEFLIYSRMKRGNALILQCCSLKNTVLILYLFLILLFVSSLFLFFSRYSSSVIPSSAAASLSDMCFL